jgi:hypothetical protein
MVVVDPNGIVTMISEDRVRRIMDIEPLLARHPKESVLSTLEDLYIEKEKILKKLISEDKTSSKINELMRVSSVAPPTRISTHDKEGAIWPAPFFDSDDHYFFSNLI